MNSTTVSHASPRSPIVTYWRKIGGGSLLLSLAIHVVIIAVALVIIQKSTSKEKPVDFLPHGGSQVAAEAKQALADKVQIKRQNELNKKTPLHPIAIDRITEVNVPVVVDDYIPAPTGADGFLNPRPLGPTGPANIPGPGTTGPPTPKPTILTSRCDSRTRLQKIRDNGGTPQCELAVSKSLEWLKTKQNPEGSWGTQHKGAMTALALLCYLGRCELPDSPFYGDNVQRGLLYLIELSAKNDRGIFSEKPTDNAASYEHGLATYALGEMYAMARLGNKSLPGMRESFEKGVRLIMEHQLPDGGWGYGDGFCYRKTGPGDLSVTGWQFQALKAAKYSGLNIPDLHKSIERTVKYLVSKQTKDGGFGNANREQSYNQWNLSGAGVLGLQTLGGGTRTAELKKGVRFAEAFLTKEPPHWGDNCNLYAWYYYAQAFFQNGGDAWKKWNDAVLREILSHQSPDGSWPQESDSTGVATTAPAGADRPIYRAALCTLMLEVYYRYLKVGDREERSIFEKK